MLNQILQYLSVDKILYYFKEKSLNIPGGQNLNLESLLEPQKISILKISDSDILKNILPSELASLMFTQGHVTLLSFIFALRHKITICNLLFHISSLQASFKEEEKEALFLIGKDLKLKEMYDEFYPILQPEFWGSQFNLPLLGFSAVGCLFRWQKSGTCRAFDHYDVLNCAQLGTPLFCKEHWREIFWQDAVADKASTQAKMFEFYWNKNNFKEYDEAALTKLLGQFYHKYQAHFKSSFEHSGLLNSTKIKEQLQYYHFDSLQDLKQNGLEELRKRFWDKAKVLHPDCGGSQELFREARTLFENLRELI